MLVLQHRVGDAVKQHAILDRLQQVQISASADRERVRLRRVVAGDDDQRQGFPPLLQAVKHIEPVDPRHVQIEHNGAVYQLRATKLGKLILTK